MLDYNIAKAVREFTYELNIPISEEKIDEELNRHPNYPSLLSISDVLTNLNVKNSALRVESNQLTSFVPPFLAHTSLDSQFIVISDVRDGVFTFSNGKHGNKKLNFSDFTKIFSGVILIADPFINKTVKNKFKRQIQKYGSVGVEVAFLSVLFLAIKFHTSFLNLSDPKGFILVAVKTIGLGISGMLLGHSIGNDNSIIKSFCKINKRANCNDLLSSNAAEIFKGLKWSEVGFFYFSGTWILTFFNGESATFWYVLAALNILSLPYTIYSIYYQAQIAKSWCILCSSVQLLLWVEFLIFVEYYFKIRFIYLIALLKI